MLSDTQISVAPSKFKRSADSYSQTVSFLLLAVSAHCLECVISRDAFVTEACLQKHFKLYNKRAQHEVVYWIVGYYIIVCISLPVVSLTLGLDFHYIIYYSVQQTVLKEYEMVYIFYS